MNEAQRDGNYCICARRVAMARHSTTEGHCECARRGVTESYYTCARHEEPKLTANARGLTPRRLPHVRGASRRKPLRACEVRSDGCC